MIYRNGSLEFRRFLHSGFLKPAGSDLARGSSLMIYDFLYQNLDFLHENLRFSLWKILIIFFMIFLTIHKIFYNKVRVSMESVELAGWVAGF